MGHSSIDSTVCNLHVTRKSGRHADPLDLLDLSALSKPECRHVSLLNAPAPADMRPAFEVADIVRHFGAAYRDARPVPLFAPAVLHAIEVCRTGPGGHIEQCTSVVTAAGL